ncbi:MAG: hypothetical protein FWD94_04405 [Treponema sp.]|nr:hypothetical protein [Treponema sp.]
MDELRIHGDSENASADFNAAILLAAEERFPETLSLPERRETFPRRIDRE